MDYLVAVLTLLILAFLYWRMIKREIPDPIKPFQAILPFALGILSMIIYSPYILWFITNIAPKISIAEGIHPFFRGMFSAFLMAGFPEEVLKLIFILITLAVLRSKVRNVYEYILIGACIGIGFSLAEEFSYGGDESATIVSTFGRMVSVPAHMTFNMVMAEFLGRARFSKLSGKGSAALNCVLALLVPIAVHTLYDVSTAFNASLMRGEMSGLVTALIGYVGLLVYELVVLIRCRKKTAMFCGMSTLAEASA